MAATTVEEPKATSDDAAAAATEASDRVFENVQAVVADGVDLQKSLKLSGFTLDDDWKEKVKDALKTKFDILPESIEGLRLCTNESSGKDVVITFGAGLHAKRIFIESKTSDLPYTFEMLASDDKPSGDFIVSDEVGDDGEQKDGAWVNLAENETAPAETETKETAAAGGKDKTNGINKSGTIAEVNGEHKPADGDEVNSTAVDESGEHDNDNEHEHDNENGADDQGGDKGGRKKREEIKFEVIWDGAPEFQWRTCSNPDDRCKLIIENVSLGELTDPFMYQAVQRAISVEYRASVHTAGNFKVQQAQQVEHNVLRRGRLTLTYQADVRAMAQAMNCLVYMRSRPNKRLKIFLPQTPATVRMKATLESRLGRVIEPLEKTSKLLIRGVVDELDEEQVKAAFPTYKDSVRSVETLVDQQDFPSKGQQPMGQRGGGRMNMQRGGRGGAFRGAPRGRGGPVNRPMMTMANQPRYMEPRNDRAAWGGRGGGGGGGGLPQQGGPAQYQHQHQHQSAAPTYGGGMQSGVLEQHTRQLEMQQQLMRQQEMISELASELQQVRRPAAVGAFDGARAGGQHTLASGVGFGAASDYAVDQRGPAAYNTGGTAAFGATQRGYGSGGYGGGGVGGAGGGYMGYNR